MSRYTLYQLLNQHFDKSELRELCFQLGIDYENLLSQRKSDLAQELIRYCERHRRLPDLLAACREARPAVSWPETAVSENLGLPPIPLWQRPWVIAAVVAVLLLGAINTLLANSGVQEWWAARTAETAVITPARPNEILIVVATFYRAEGVADAEAHNEIRRAISAAAEEMDFSNLRVALAPTVLRAEEREAAQALGEEFDASIVIWGEETAVRVTVNYLNLRESDLPAADVEISTAKPEAYVKLITEDLPGQLTFLSLFAVGQSYGVSGRYDIAAATIERAIASLSPEMEPPEGAAEAYFRLAWLKAQMRGDVAQIIDLYSEAIALRPDFVFAYNNRGAMYGRQHKLTEALADFDRAIELNPDYPIAYSNRGYAHYQQQAFEAALSDLEQALAIEPTYALAYLNRGKVRRAQGETAGAMSDFNNAVKYDPNHANSYWERGRLRADQGDVDGALADYNQALALDPDHAGAYNSRGLLRGEQGDLEAALVDFSRAIEIEPDKSLAYNNRGYTYLQMGKLDAALGDLNRAVELAPRYDLAYLNRGVVRQRLPDLDGAIADFSQVIALDDDYVADAYRERGETYRELGDVEAAIADGRQYLTLKPDAEDRETVEAWLAELEATAE